MRLQELENVSGPIRKELEAQLERALISIVSIMRSSASRESGKGLTREDIEFTLLQEAAIIRSVFDLAAAIADRQSK